MAPKGLFLSVVALFASASLSSAIPLTIIYDRADGFDFVADFQNLDDSSVTVGASTVSVEQIEPFVFEFTVDSPFQDDVFILRPLNFFTTPVPTQAFFGFDGSGAEMRYYAVDGARPNPLGTFMILNTVKVSYGFGSREQARLPDTGSTLPMLALALVGVAGISNYSRFATLFRRS